MLLELFGVEEGSEEALTIGKALNAAIEKPLFDNGWQLGIHSFDPSKELVVIPEGAKVEMDCKHTCERNCKTAHEIDVEKLAYKIAEIMRRKR